jgi:hypothetical protein
MASNQEILEQLNKDLGISQPDKAPTTGVVTPLRPKDILNQDINISDPVLKNLMSSEISSRVF